MTGAPEDWNGLDASSPALRFPAPPAEAALSPAPCPVCGCGAMVGPIFDVPAGAVVCPACLNERPTVEGWNAWATRAPAPLPFTAPHDFPVDLPLALDDLRGDLDDMRATLDALAATVARMVEAGPSVAGLLSAAEDAENLSDLAAEAARAIHDAIPGMVAEPAEVGA